MDGRSITSMILGIVSVVMCWACIGVITGPIAIVLSSKFKREYVASGNRLRSRGMALTGFITGIVGIALSVIYAVVWIVMLVGLRSVSRIH
jgi:hypothetical protein